jgi:ADP-heptose:LPS heptosyltransferase
VIEKPDPTYWVRWQLGTLTPRLSWNPSWDHLVENFDLDLSKRYIGVHLQTETNYGYEKNWPLSSFNALIDILITKYGKKVILFGSQPSSMASRENVVDLRGKTTLTQMLSIIKNLCSHLIAPDSGVLSMAYYIDSPFPLHIVSLWADPCQGVLKQAVASPNNLLMHIPLIAEGRDLRGITVEKVLETLALNEGAVNLSP